MVDYLCIPHDCYRNCSNFRVVSPETLVQHQGLQHLLGIRSKLPDHYFISGDFTYSYSCMLSKETENIPEPTQTQTPFNERRYKLNRIFDDFMQTNVSRAAILELIQQIVCCRDSQDNIMLIGSITLSAKRL